MESILESMKRMIGISDDDDSFDTDLIIDINSIFTILNQLGAGPPNGFEIIDSREVWTDFMPDISKINLIKSYVYLKLKLMFDPPASSSVMDAMNRQISEFEWRISISCEEGQINGK